MSWQTAVEKTVTGLGYDMVLCEWGSQGLLRVFIDRIPGQPYDGGGASVTVEDCERVTRQLQYVLEVEACDYRRLEVSSPGLDRPLRRAADFVRFCGQQVEVTLKLPFEGRKKYQGALRQGEGEGWELVFADGKTNKVLGFVLDELRDARLVPLVDFKKKRRPVPASVDNVSELTQKSGGHEE